MTLSYQLVIQPVLVPFEEITDMFISKYKEWIWICISNTFIVSFSQNVPPDVSVCGFILAHCLSVRALQEMLTHTEHLAAEVRHNTNSIHFILPSSFLFLYITGIYLF